MTGLTLEGMTGKCQPAALQLEIRLGCSETLMGHSWTLQSRPLSLSSAEEILRGNVRSSLAYANVERLEDVGKRSVRDCGGLEGLETRKCAL